MRNFEKDRAKDTGNGKIERVLGIYTCLINGQAVNRAKEAERYRVNERSIQRDIDDIRNCLELEAKDTGYINTVSYDRDSKGYRMEQLCKMKRETVLQRF